MLKSSKLTSSGDLKNSCLQAPRLAVDLDFEFVEIDFEVPVTVRAVGDRGLTSQLFCDLWLFSRKSQLGLPPLLGIKNVYKLGNVDADTEVFGLKSNPVGQSKDGQTESWEVPNVPPIAGKFFLLVGAGGPGRALAFGVKSKGARAAIFNLNFGDDQIDLYAQLWHECAGSIVKVPRVGDKVFYFPQGHLEQIEAYMKQQGITDVPSYGLPSKILCEVVHVQLKAEADTDEVFAQIALLPECDGPEGSTFRSVSQKVPASSFRKRLTPSDTSKQGGCSLPKRHVGGTFPPLDMSRNISSQELVAKDLHGAIWHFQHTYHGIPKRHLLTSGWGKFVSAKRLVAGDTCIFLRGQNELYVGVRRAVRLQKPSIALSCLSMQHGILATALYAMNTRTMFTVYYHPWTSPSGFIVAYDEVMESLQINYSPRMSVEMLFDSGGEVTERNLTKFAGMIVGVGDIDPVRWPGSEWRRLKVQWDATTYGHVLPGRVSPWSIQSLDFTVQHQQSSVPLDQKRSMPFQPMISNFPYSETNDYNHLGGLQGQEIIEGTGSTLSKVNFPSSSYQDQTNSALVNSVGLKCKLFGVDIWDSNTDGPSQSGTSQLIISNCFSSDNLEKQCQNHSSVTTRSYTKVLKHGTALGRSIDLSHFIGYKGLVFELDRMFEFEGTLVNGTSGWLITYANGDNNKMLLGDISWSQFRAVVRKMFICPREEVDRADRSG